MKIISLVFFLLTFSVSTQAGIVEDFKAYVRPRLENILGVEKTNQLLGNDPLAIEMPKIPRIDRDAKSISGFGQGPKNEVTFKKDQIERFNYVFVKEVFEVTRKSAASDADISKWMNVLSQNGSREGVYRALVLDSVYLGLENYETLTSERLADFTIDFLSRYLDKAVSEKALRGANFYTVKRDISERCLEVLDIFLNQPGEEVYNWYALVSSDLASNFPEAMNNKTRKETSPAKHKLWAKSVPDQFIKSEIIIKLHRVFNFIQG